MSIKTLRTTSAGSILPAILELETELDELERETRDRSEKIVQDAREKATALVDQARIDAGRIEEEERERLINEVDDRIEEIERTEKKELERLHEQIEKTRDDVLAHILGKVIPGDTGGNNMQQ